MKVIEYKITCTTEGQDKFWLLKDGAPSPTTCPTDSAHTVDLSSITVVGEYGVDADVRTDGEENCLVITPGIMAGTFTPESPTIIDNHAGELRGLTVKTKANCHLEFSRSLNADNPIDAGGGNTHSNIEWAYAGELRLTGEGPHPISKDFLDRFSGSRYLKIEPIKGDMFPNIQRFAS